jgi:hypothetical protein
LTFDVNTELVKARLLSMKREPIRVAVDLSLRPGPVIFDVDAFDDSLFRLPMSTPNVSHQTKRSIFLSVPGISYRDVRTTGLWGIKNFKCWNSLCSSAVPFLHRPSHTLRCASNVHLCYVLPGPRFCSQLFHIPFSRRGP